VQAGESYLGCHIHKDTLVSRRNQPEAGGCGCFLAAQEKKDFFSKGAFRKLWSDEAHEVYENIPAVDWVILLPLQLGTHHIGQAPGPASASPHLPKLLDQQVQKRPEQRGEVEQEGGFV
jgi:hypothetical protein